MKIKLILSFTTLMLSGCTTQWIKNSASAEDFATSKAACIVLSEEKYPVENRGEQKEPFTHEVFNVPSCNNWDECRKRKYFIGQGTPMLNRGVRFRYRFDSDKPIRQRVFSQCMTLRGWSSETKWFP